MDWQPTFKCPNCGKNRSPTNDVLMPCSCKDSQEAYERNHRVNQERRKVAERQVTGPVKPRKVRRHRK